MVAQAQPAADASVYFVIAIIILVAICTIGMLVLRFGHHIGESNQRARARRVKQTSYGAYPVMSRLLFDYPDDRPVARHVNESLGKPLPVIAKPGNAINDRLPVDAPGNAASDQSQGAGDDRNSLQYRERLTALAILINAGTTPQAEGIEKLFGCTRSGRKDSKYAQVRADLLPLLKKEAPVISTPIAGRETNAVFHSDNPELQYQEP